MPTGSADETLVRMLSGLPMRRDIGEAPIRFSCYLDHSLLEIYLNETKSVSLRNYFTQPRYFQVCGNIQSMQLWEMTSAYPEE
jgi:hypothetical protein